MWLDDLQSLMEDAPAVCTLGGDLYLTTGSTVPILASGRATLQIVETSGGGPERTQNKVVRPGYIHLAAQFMARAGTYDDAKAMAQAAYNRVVGIRNSWITNGGVISGWYREINPLQEPFDPGIDDRGQARCEFNVVAIRRPS